MSEELKPCPFCGGSVELERARDTRDEIMGVRQWWGVVCRNTINRGGTCAIEQRPSASQEAAIERWNRRATPPSPSTASEVGELPPLLAKVSDIIECYAESYDMMARISKDGRAGCTCVATDLRQNIIRQVCDAISADHKARAALATKTAENVEHIEAAPPPDRRHGNRRS